MLTNHTNVQMCRCADVQIDTKECPRIPKGNFAANSLLCATAKAKAARGGEGREGFRRLFRLFPFFFCFFVAISSIAQTTTQNYIRTRTPRTAINNNTTLDTYTSNKTKVETSIQYFDGLDRPLQTIQVAGSPLGYDMVQPYAYDGYGREATKYLPYTPQSGTAGAYRSTAITDQTSFYTTPPTGSGVSAITDPFSQTGFEISPLNRPTEQGAPGPDWQLGAHTVKIAYTLNNSTAFSADSINGRQVALYRTTISSNQGRRITASGYYAAGALTVTVSRDENTATGRAGTVEEYKDNMGHVVLKRVYNYESNAVKMLSTYYVYDDFGLLAFVLPPAALADADTNPAQGTLDNLCYQYRYDERNRMSQKKIPGKGWEYTAFNLIDQPIATQDSVQGIANQWIYTKYDALGRPVTSGIWTNNGVAIGRQSLQSGLTHETALWESPVNTGNGYNNLAWPRTYTTPLTIDYYDNYNNIPGLPSNYTLSTGITNMTRSLPTVKKTAVLNTPADMLWDVMYYDDLGRSIKTYAQHYFGGTLDTAKYDLLTTTYDFTNAPTTVTRQHHNNGGLLVTIANTYYYDHMGRKRSAWEQITNAGHSSDTKRLVSRMDYNEIGQALNKHLHGGTADSTAGLQTIAYTYNERGWLSTSSAPLFAMQLYYNNVSTGNKEWNGNIMYQYWGTPGSLTNHYTYLYDKMNRLTSGMSTAGNHENNITYDVMGNMKTMQRYAASTRIDKLSYTLISGTNQLQSVTDSSGNNAGLINGAMGYTYDGNGNMLAAANTVHNAQNKSFTYNLLNLPITVTTPTAVITYTYDATGNKLRKASLAGGVTTYTDYVSGIQYGGTTSETISFIQTEEGRAISNGSATYNYEYYLSDNLGNTRITFDTSSGTATQQQKDDYYPFGMEILTGSPASPKNEYLYNKKELQEEFTEYDYGARFYDPVIARWTSVDPLAEKGRRWSPYNYGENNPIKNIDIDGDSVKATSFTINVAGIEITTINYSVTGKVENDSSNPYTNSQMQDITSLANNAIAANYTAAGTSDSGEIVVSNGSSYLTAASASNPVIAGDDVVKLVDPGKVPAGNNDGTFASPNNVAMSKPGENVSYVSTSTLSGVPATTGEFANTGKTSTGGPTFGRTVSHEVGHLFGLDDMKGKGTPKNLMRQTGSPDAGTNLTPGQLKEMEKNYKNGKLNTGQQSFH